MHRTLCLLFLCISMAGCFEAVPPEGDHLRIAANAFVAVGAWQGKQVSLSVGEALTKCTLPSLVPSNCYRAALDDRVFLLPTASMEPIRIDTDGSHLEYGPLAFADATPLMVLSLAGTHAIGSFEHIRYLGLSGEVHFVGPHGIQIRLPVSFDRPSTDATRQAWVYVYDIELEPGFAIPRAIAWHLSDANDSGGGSGGTEIWRADTIEVGKVLEATPSPSTSLVPEGPLLASGKWNRQPPSSAVPAMRFPISQAVDKAREQSSDVGAFFDRFPKAFLVDATYQSQGTTLTGPTSLVWVMEWWGAGTSLRFSVQMDLPDLPIEQIQFQTDVVGQNSNQVTDLDQKRDDMVTWDAAYSACVTEAGPFFFAYRDLMRENPRPDDIVIGGQRFRPPANYDCQFGGAGYTQDAYLGILTRWRE